MRILALASTHAGSGQITVLVNLASGLVRQGQRVIIGQLGPSERLYKWLGVTPGLPLSLRSDTAREDLKNHISTSSLGMDFITLALSADDHPPLDLVAGCLEQLGYDYLLLNPTSMPVCHLLASSRAKVLVCTDLQGDDEVQEIQALQDQLQAAGGAPEGISLIVANRIETKEWDHNSQQLMALGDHFGYEKLADPIPT